MTKNSFNELIEGNSGQIMQLNKEITLLINERESLLHNIDILEGKLTSESAQHKEKS
jgi:hypothetical protein